MAHRKQQTKGPEVRKKQPKPPRIRRWYADQRSWQEKLRMGQLGTVDDAAAVLDLPKSWIYSNAKRIPGYQRYGRHIRFCLRTLVNHHGEKMGADDGTTA